MYKPKTAKLQQQLTAQSLGDTYYESVFRYKGNRFLPFPKRPDWFSGPPNLLFNGNRGLFPRGG